MGLHRVGHDWSDLAAAYFKVKDKLQWLSKGFEKHFGKNFGKYILVEFLHYVHHGMINNIFKNV